MINGWFTRLFYRSRAEQKVRSMRKIARVLLIFLATIVPGLAETHGKSGADAKASQNAHVESVSPTYIGVEPIYTTIIEGDSVIGLFMVGFGLDVPDDALRERVKAVMPRLRDLYIRSLLSFTAANIHTWRRPNITALADKLQRVTDIQMKCKGVKILLAQAAIRLNK